MVGRPMAHEALCALRRQIEGIENPAPRQRLATGASGLDRALGGGIEPAALCEIQTEESRNGGAAAGFVLALASIAMRATGLPLLWIGTGSAFREAGFPYAEGLREEFGIDPGAFLLAEARKPLDALWIAAEAAGLAVIILEMHGNPACLDLAATRRLHHRARAGGWPVFLLRLCADCQPTAAPLRLGVKPAPASARHVFGQPLPGTIGRPAFAVSLEKCRANPGGQFILEWNCNERRFHGRRWQAEDPVALVSPSFNRPDPAPPLRAGLANGSAIRRKTG